MAGRLSSLINPLRGCFLDTPRPLYIGNDLMWSLIKNFLKFKEIK